MRDELREAERRIAEHPGYREHMELDALNLSITAVFVPNLKELLELLEEASTNELLAVELVQNAHEPVVRDRFHSDLIRRLHNYLASAQSLVDHVRHLMDNRTGPISEEFLRRKQELLRNPEVLFMKDLRNFTLHWTLPFFAHSFVLNNVNKPEQTMESEVELSIGQLLKWDKWSAPARAYLVAQGEVVVLRPVIKKHGQLVLGLNAWVHNELSEANAEALEQVNKLVAIRNAVLAGPSRE